MRRTCRFVVRRRSSRNARVLGSLFALVLGAAACSPTESVSAGPSSTATDPVPSPSNERIVVARDDRGEHAMRLVIVDSQGVVASVAAAEPDEITPVAERLPSSRIAAVGVPGQSPRILLVWSGFACDQSGSVTISMPGPSLAVAPDPIDNCDLVPSYRGLLLTFAQPVAVGSLHVTLVPTEVTGA